MGKEVVLTGLRTNAEYHLGNYLGAILPMVQMAKQHAGKYQVNMFAPDLHSFTTPIDNSKLYAQTMHNLKLFAACGLPLDHEDIFIYRQSYVPAHSELTVILNNFAYFGELSRMTQFKEKSLQNLQEDSSQNIDLLEDFATRTAYSVNVSVGLFDYPVLMASDILLYDSLWVPVGEDQRQHLEFTRDLATRFNNKFGKTFTIPKAVEEQQKFINRDAAPRIRSLRNPNKKMSKSIDDFGGTILLTDSPEVAIKKVMGATTDNVGVINYDWEKQPGVTNLLQILALLNHKSQKELNSEWVGKQQYGELKKAVADAISALLLEIKARYSQIDDSELLTKIELSEKILSESANSKLQNVQRAVGLRA